MCLSTPDIPKPDVPQEAKQPDFTAMLSAKRKRNTLTGGTWITGPSGVQQSAASFGAPTLLGSTAGGGTVLGG